MTDVLERTSGRRDLPALIERADKGAPLYETMAALLRHPRIMLVVPLLCFTIAVGAAFLRSDFNATSKLTPQSSESSLANFAGVAAQLGVAVPTPRQNESVDFYADLVKSRELLDSLALSRFRFATGTGDRDTLEGTYIDLYHITGATDFDKLFKARRKLEGKVSVTMKRQSAIVTVTTKAKWGQLAEQMNRRLLDLVNSFNLERRQSQARAERQFLDDRLRVLGDDLRDVQAEQRTFLERNRSWENDPALALQMQNLVRRVQEAQQANAALVQRYEQARVDEVRNTPVITIVEAPEGSRRRSRGLLLAGLLGIATGGILATALALVLDQASRERVLYPETYDAVRGLWEGLPRRLLGRRRTES